MNIVTLHGRLCGDPELKYAAGSGTAVTKFTIAVDRFKKGEADFIRCIAFNKAAETIANYLIKGSEIVLTGHIQTGSYDNKDGQKVFTTDVIVDRFDFCGKSEKPASQDKSKEEYTPVESDDLEVPF